MECVLVETTLRQHHVLSTTAPDNCVAFFDVCDTGCPIGKLPFVMNFLRRVFSVCHSFPVNPVE